MSTYPIDLGQIIYRGDGESYSDFRQRAAAEIKKERNVVDKAIEYLTVLGFEPDREAVRRVLARDRWLLGKPLVQASQFVAAEYVSHPERRGPS